jgi:GTPase SAR1 family protein
MKSILWWKSKQEKNKNLEDYLRVEKKKYQQQRLEPKLLILGSSDSGKSTLLKQMKLLYYGGFKENEIQAARKSIRSNLIQYITALWEIMESEEIKQKYHALEDFATKWNAKIDNYTEIIDSYDQFCNEPYLKKCVEESKVLPCAAQYFLGDVKRFLTDDYQPTTNDILNLRVVTIKVTDTVFEVNNRRIHFFDVGGATYFRTKWISYFDNVQNILFVTSLSCYDQNLVEDPSTNRAADAIMLFFHICHLKLLLNTGIILFLNKRDLFEKKVVKIPIKKFFEDYSGEEFSETDGKTFFYNKYMDSTKKRKLSTSCHLICCTDTDSMKKLLGDIM